MLKHHPDTTLLDGTSRHLLITKKYLAARISRFKSRQNTQQGGFATARGPKQRHNLTRFYL